MPRNERNTDRLFLIKMGLQLPSLVPIKQAVACNDAAVSSALLSHYVASSRACI